MKFRWMPAWSLVLACGFSATLAWSQNFPSKAVRIIEPAGPGSAVDVFARKLATPLADRLGQAVVVDNKPGIRSDFSRPTKGAPPSPTGWRSATSPATGLH